MGAAKKLTPERISEACNFQEVSSEAMVTVGTDGQIVRINTRAEELLGYSQDALLGQGMDLLLPRESRGRRVKQRADRVASPKISPIGYGLEVLLRRCDGTVFTAEVGLSLLKSRSETQILATIREVEGEHPDKLDLRAIVEASNDAIIGKTLNGTIVRWNKGAEKMYGYTKGEILRRPISVLIPREHPNELPAIMEQLQRGEPIESYETTRVHKDGHCIDVALTIAPVKSKSGAVVGASVVARDITRHKQAEEALRLSEERFRVALKNAPVVVFSQDLQLRYTWINSPVLAWGSQDYVGRTDAEIIGGEEGSRLTAIKEQVLSSGAGSHAEITVTFEGVAHYFDLVVEPLRNGEGKLIGALSSAIDTTSLKTMIVTMERALHDVQVLSGLLPICAHCKKIKDEKEVWQPLEGYIQCRSQAKFTHGLCPDCLRELYPDYYPDETQQHD